MQNFDSYSRTLIKEREVTKKMIINQSTQQVTITITSAFFSFLISFHQFLAFSFQVIVEFLSIL